MEDYNPEVIALHQIYKAGCTLYNLVFWQLREKDWLSFLIFIIVFSFVLRVILAKYF